MMQDWIITIGFVFELFIIYHGKSGQLFTN